MSGPTIVLAGAAGNLGGRIARALLERGASVRALIRRGRARDKLERLQKLGATIVRVDFGGASQVTPACSGAFCVVSALAGLREKPKVLLDCVTCVTASRDELRYRYALARERGIIPPYE
ncbi:MAG: NmrA family NAD(P)-binding protein [Terriglobia bacterium]|jgi:uncharacterized protein YbjT (DUF2867 family)